MSLEFTNAMAELTRDCGAPDPVAAEATETYLALHWEVRKAIRAYAIKHNISFATAVAEACRSYFMPE